METLGRITADETWDADLSSGEENEHQYDDYEDLFSNETASTAAEDHDDGDVGKYLDTDPELQKQVAQLIMLRRHLDSLTEKLSEKKFAVLKSREELIACRTRLKALKEELTENEYSVVSAQETENIAALHRLVSKDEKLKQEIENEKKMEVEISKSLQEAELDLSHVEIEQRHYTSLAEQVVEKEENVAKHKQKMAKYRIVKEEKAARMKERKFQLAEENLSLVYEERERMREKITEEAIINHEKAVEFLKSSLHKLREAEAVKENSRKAQVGRKVEAIISLKNNIAQNRENLKALQARDAAYKKKKEMDEQLERKQVLNEGGNPEQVLLRRKKFAQIEQEKQAFAEKQKENEAKIVSTILKEEEYNKKLKKLQSRLWGNKEGDKQKQIPSLPKCSVQNKIELADDYKPVFLEQANYLKKSQQKDERREMLSEESSVVEDLPQDDERETAQLKVSKAKKQEILTQPEFPGLWDQKHKVYKVPKEEVITKPVGGTKMECEILEKTMKKHREGITVKQVAAGKEFKGQPFYSKPDVIHFKDLDVGKTYKKKVVITNVSYSINFLKLVGLSEHLKDFIKIDFNPPGQMSAGMSCDMTVTFKPMINEDLVGEVAFMAQTGPFSIALKCTTKKCDLSVDVNSIDFGAQVIGETIRRSVTLVNKGGLGTRFEFMKIPDRPATLYTMETSLGRLTTADSAGVTPMDISEPLKTATTTQPETARKSKRPLQSVPQTADNMSSVKEPEPSPVKEDTFEVAEKIEYEEEDCSRTEGDMFATPATGFNENVPDELKVGEVMSGEVEAFSSVRLDIVFSPCIPGDIQAGFRIAFSDPESHPLEIKVTAVAIDVPVWLERQNIDLRICMYDRLYQEQIQVHNRASTALRLNFEVPKELRGHIELLPKTGYIQAKSKFTAQLKFLPRQSLAEDAAGLFDPETGILESPMVLRVADQTRPVPFVVNAVVTSSDLEFNQTEVDFGFCSIHESVVRTVKLTSHSILPQMFGFVCIPDYVDVQPNEGFGWILPLETISIHLIMNAKRARLHEFTLVCRTGINRNFTINCKATGVHPPLELSHQVVHFSATPLDDDSTAILYVMNTHTSANEFTHPVPRIGKGEIAPVGPTSFEFVVPEDAPITITPAVGIVKPGEKCHVTFEFSPKLNESDIRIEACNVFEQQREEKEKEEQEKLKREAEEAEQRLQEEEKLQKGKKTPKTPAKPKTGESAPKSRKPSAKGSGKQIAPEKPTPESIDVNSTEYKAASAYLTRNYKGSFQSYTIPCFVASGPCSENADRSSLLYHEVNTLFVEVHCPVIKPPVVIISNHGHYMTDFGQVSIGQNAIQPISIQNISGQPVDLVVSILDTNGPFQMLNALRTLRADETHTVLVSFTPTIGKVFQEVLKINGPSSSLSISLTGKGVTPVIKLTPENGKIDFGTILQQESATASFTLENKSSLAVKYSMHMDSNSLLKHAKLQQLPDFIARDDQPRHTLIGPQNLDGSCVFDCVPCEGEIKTDKKHEIQVTFRPDHESRHFSDGARVILFSTEEAHVIHLTGKSVAYSMFIEGNDPLDVNVESLALDRHRQHHDIPPTRNIVVSFMSRVTGEGFASVRKELDIGCVRSSAPTAKKSGEWIVDNVNAAHAKGFSIEPLKCTVEADCTKPLTLTWNPPEDHDPSNPCTTSIQLTLKADVPLTYNVLLNGLVSFS